MINEFVSQFDFLGIYYGKRIIRRTFMCGFVGFVNLEHDLQNRREILTRMTKKLAKRGPDEENFYLAPRS